MSALEIKHILLKQQKVEVVCTKNKNIINNFKGSV